MRMFPHLRVGNSQLTFFSYMFHQANMRVADVPTASLNGVRGKFSLLMIWTETVAQEMMRL